MVRNQLVKPDDLSGIKSTRLKDLINTLIDRTDLTPASAADILADAGIEMGDLIPYADFDHPSNECYGRKLVFAHDHFELMVMSWAPGDFSAIHDHGPTQWGAVQVYGNAEHAVFRISENVITTASRTRVAPGETVPVGHSLVHQMGNPGSQSFLSLHLYGSKEVQGGITEGARVFDPVNKKVMRVSGGAFFEPDTADIISEEDGPAGDWLTNLRHTSELMLRLSKSNGDQSTRIEHHSKVLIEQIDREAILELINNIIDRNGHVVDSAKWNVLNSELKVAAGLIESHAAEDRFSRYARLYDEVIGKPCLEDFIRPALHQFADKYGIDFSQSSIISLGCGTGLIEEAMINELGVDREGIYGIDISPSMVLEARKRIQADEGDILTLDPCVCKWDIAFTSLNVLQYVDHTRFEEAVFRTASIVESGGFFIGDFITPDHIRWYPNCIVSDDRFVISLRTPELVHDQGALFQESEIINLNFSDGVFVNYAGKHRRFLPTVQKVRRVFEDAFKGKVDIVDAVSLESLGSDDDSCPSTRYFVIAQKNERKD